MKSSGQDSVMKRASSAAARTGSWSAAKREYANKVTHSGSFSHTLKVSRQQESQINTSAQQKKK
jgi:hypothetical protein